MDTHSIEPPLSETEALRRLVSRVLAGGDAVVAAAGDASGFLDAAAGELAGQRRRVLRVSASAPGGLSLSGFMAQVTGRQDLDGHDDSVLERGSQALTATDAECDAVVLMVSGADGLQRTVLRYVQFACRATPALHLVLAGEPDLTGPELAPLRTRLAAAPVIRLVPSPAVPDAAPALAGVAHSPPMPPAPAPVKPIVEFPNPLAPVPARSPVSLLSNDLTRRRAPSVWAALGLSLAAGLAFGVLIGRGSWKPEPALVPVPAPEAAQPSAPSAASASAAQPAPATDATQAAAVPKTDPVPVTPPAPSAAPATSSNPAEAAPPPAAQPATTPARPKPALPARPLEARSREPSPFRSAYRGWGRHPGTPSDAGRSAPLADWSPAEPPSPEAPWQPPSYAPPPSYGPPSWGTRGGDRPIVGTYATDQYGVRSFRSVP